MNFALEEAMKWEYKYGSTLSLASELDGGGWLKPRLCRFTPGKQTRHSFYRRLSGPQGQSGRVSKISLSPGFDPKTVRPVAGRYTSSAVPASC